MRRWMLAILVLVATAGIAGATSRSIHVEWGYTPPTEPEVTGFQLYQEGAAVCVFEGASTTEGDCTVDLTTTITNFTLTAMFSDDTESPHSTPFAFNSTLDSGVIITWTSWVWFAHPGRKHVRIGADAGLKGARLR